MIRINRQGALVISAVLHAAVLGFGLVSWRWFGRAEAVEVTPITILSSDEVAKLVAANRSEEPTPAQTEQPDPTAAPLPDAAVEAPQPAPAPTPAPSPPKAMPAPAPKAAEKAPRAKAPDVKVAAAKPAPLNLDALAESLAKSSTRASGRPRSNAPSKGPARAETDLTDRIAEGLARASTDDALGLMRDKLMRLWNPACDVDGAPNVSVVLHLNEDGSLERAELADGRRIESITTNPELRAAAERALLAARRGSPYSGLPRESYSRWRAVRVLFDGRKACDAD